MYHKLGNIPRKRHTAFRRETGELYHEHLMGSRGFSGPSTLLYHLRPPTSVLSTTKLESCSPEAAPDGALRMRHFHLLELPAGKDLILDRTLLLFNDDVAVRFVQTTSGDPSQESCLYRNAQADEVVYVAEGQGALVSWMGELTFSGGDYLVIPRGVLHQYRSMQPLKLLIIESVGMIRPPSRYRNQEGQFLEHSPYCERDIRAPHQLTLRDETGEFRVLVKRDQALFEVILNHHPFDVVGWDGHYYPWALSIHDFEPITGSLHQPPPVHQTFQGDGFVVCSFVPRLFDYHPQAVPAPYNHSNVNSDEVLFYANNEFMSRKGIGYGSLTLHPAGLVHGPHPGRVEASIGKKRTEELAVMVDTFRPLSVSNQVAVCEDRAYERSWLESSD